MNIRHKGHAEPFVVKFEPDGSVGILYLTSQSGTYSYNYVRYDTFGNRSFALPQFKTIDPFYCNDIETMDLMTPCADYCIDSSGDLWLFYVEGPTVMKKYIGWVKIDNHNTILETQKTEFIARTEIVSVPAQKSRFHLFLPPHGWAGNLCYRYYNPSLTKPVDLGVWSGNRFVPTWPFEAYDLIHLPGDRLLVVSCDRRKPFRMRSIILNDKGEVLVQNDDIPLDSCAHYKTTNGGIPFTVDAFILNDTIVTAVSVSTPWLANKVEAFYVVIFNEEGELIESNDGLKGGTTYIDSVPRDITPLLAVTAYGNGTIANAWCYGCNTRGDVYIKKLRAATRHE